MLAKNGNITPGATPGCISMKMTNEEYHAEKSYLSTSGIKLLLQSPAHFKRHQRNESPDMALGTALHTILLEPETFFDTYAVYDGDKRGKQYTEFVEANQGKVIIKQDVMNTLSGMRDSVLSYPKLDMERLLREGEKEFSIFWEDSETGINLKMRADLMIGNFIFDVKKTTDARPDKFTRRCIDLRYDIQAFMYKEGARAFLGDEAIRKNSEEGKMRFMFLAIEDTAPYGVWVHEASEEMEKRGEQDARRAINQYARCRKDNNWPNYEDPYSEITWPHWVAAKDQEMAHRR